MYGIDYWLPEPEETEKKDETVLTVMSLELLCFTDEEIALYRSKKSYESKDSCSDFYDTTQDAHLVHYF